MTANETRGAARAPWRRLVVALSLGAALACQGGGDSAGPGGSGPGGGTNIPPGQDGDDPAVPNVAALVPSEATQAAARTFVAQCSACHGDWGEGSSAPSLWKLSMSREELVAKIDATMPPKDPTLCAGACAEQLADYILERFSEEALKCEGITPAPRQLRLLNRREYANTVHTLLGLDASEPSAPSDTCGSYTFRYAPTGTVASVAVAGSFNEWSETAWPMAYDAGQGAWLLTKPLADGDYEFKFVVKAQADGSAEWVAAPGMPTTGSYGNSLLRMACAQGGGTSSAPDLSQLPVETRPVAFAFDTSVSSVINTPQLESYFAVAKTLAATLTDANAFAGCDLGGDRAGCGRTFLTRFGARAFRRPLRDAELTRYGQLLGSIADPGEALRATVTALLTSPSFLYRSELGVAQGDGSYLLTPYETASALSYVLRANMPDDALFAAAERNELATEAQIRDQALRILRETTSRGAVSDFVLQWLGVIGVSAIQRDAAEHPDFSPELAGDMLRETRTFVEHVVFEGPGTLEELLTADYTFANARLAKLYGLPGEFGEELTRASYADSARAGVLGHASVLSTFAHTNQTSPVLRGLFVRRQLMCQRFGEPPPNAGAVPTPDPNQSTRERFDMHAQGSCASCHQHIDPLGFGFEGYDAVGKARTMDGNHPVDAQGELTGIDKLSDGTSAPFSTPRELSAVLVDSAATHDCVAKQSYRFLRGELDDGLSYCAVKYVRQQYRTHGKVLDALLAALSSVDFRTRY